MGGIVCDSPLVTILLSINEHDSLQETKLFKQ